MKERTEKEVQETVANFYKLAIFKTLQVCNWSCFMLLEDRVNCRHGLRQVVRQVHDWTDRFIRRTSRNLDNKSADKLEDSAAFLFDGLMILEMCNKKHRKAMLEMMQKSVNEFLEEQNKAESKIIQ